MGCLQERLPSVLGWMVRMAVCVEGLFLARLEGCHLGLA